MAHNPENVFRGGSQDAHSPNRSQAFVFDNPVSKKETSILLDKDERELVKKGDEVTKEEMWALLEEKRFAKLREGTVQL